MEQLINTLLANAQMPQAAPAARKNGSSETDSFQTLLEQKADAQTSEKPEKADAAQKQDSAQDAEKPQEKQEPQQAGETQRPAAPKNGKELEEQMTLAAMAMLQNPVVTVEQAEMTPEIQAEVPIVDAAAPLAAEIALTPERQSFAPEEAETETTAQIPVEKAGAPAPEQAAAAAAEEEELPQTTEAPEAAQKTEERTVERTVEVKVEVREAAPQAVERSETEEEETPELRETGVETPVFEDVKAVPVKVGEAPRAAKAAEQPVEEQIAPKLTEALQSGETRVELQLTPENLGKVTVEMTWSDDKGLVVQIHAENRETQNLLNRNTANLAELLGRETQREVRVEVPRQEESQRQDLYEQQQQQHRQQQQERRQKQAASNEDFIQQLRLGLIPLEGE